MIRALIRFADHSEHWCVGRVSRDGSTVPFVSRRDVENHCRTVTLKGKGKIELVRVEET